MSSSMTGVGISIGLSNSSVAVYHRGTLCGLAGDLGDIKTPSYVSWTGRGFVVGEEAVKRQISAPKNTFHDIRRVVGHDPDETQFQACRKTWPFSLFPDTGDRDHAPFSDFRLKYVVSQGAGHRYFHPEYVMAHLIWKMKDIAEKHIGHPVQEAVLTVPASYGVNVRQAMKDAARIAGLTTVHLMSEPAAMAVAYNSRHRTLEAKDEEVMVYNFGAGCSECTIFNIHNNRVIARATRGCPYLGGDHFTNAIADFLHEQIKLRIGVDARGTVAKIRVKQEAERLKKSLTTQTLAVVKLDNFEGFDYRNTITRHLLEKLLDTAPQFKDMVEACCQNAGVDLDKVILSGGSSKIPHFRNIMEGVTGKKAGADMVFEQSPSFGAAVRAASIHHFRTQPLGAQFADAVRVVDVVSRTIQILVHPREQHVLISRQDVLPLEGEVVIQVDYTIRLPVIAKVYEGHLPNITENTLIAKLEMTFPERQRAGEYQVKMTYVMDDCGIFQVTKVQLQPDGQNIDFWFLRRNLYDHAVARLEREFRDSHPLKKRHFRGKP